MFDFRPAELCWLFHFCVCCWIIFSCKYTVLKFGSVFRTLIFFFFARLNFPFALIYGAHWGASFCWEKRFFSLLFWTILNSSMFHRFFFLTPWNVSERESGSGFMVVPKNCVVFFSAAKDSSKIFKESRDHYFSFWKIFLFWTDQFFLKVTKFGGPRPGEIVIYIVCIAAADTAKPMTMFINLQGR